MNSEADNSMILFCYSKKKVYFCSQCVFFISFLEVLIRYLSLISKIEDYERLCDYQN